MAVYVMRLSMALVDLKIVAGYATRRRQRQGERVYFVRLFSLHMREIVKLLDPPNRRIVPTIDDFLDSLPRGTKPSRTEIRGHHAKLMRRLAKPMKGREKREFKRRGKPSVWRVPTLRDELKRTRDEFAHYGDDAEGTKGLIAAMESARDIRMGYKIRERAWRAEYADTVATTLLHPFDLDDREAALDMHGRVIDLVGPVSSYIHYVEAAWLSSRPEGVVRSRRL